MWLLVRRRAQRRRERQQAAAAASAAAAQQQHDPRRQRTDDVHRMIAEKRSAARVARKPFLVVHPSGDAEVAFQDAAAPCKATIPAHRSSEEGSGQAGLIKAQPHAYSSERAAYAQGLLSRRALVAAAALSGRTHSGISDMSYDASDIAADEEAAGRQAAEQPGDGLERQAHLQPQQLEQHDWHRQGDSSVPLPARVSGLSRHSSLAASTQALPPDELPTGSAAGGEAGQGAIGTLLLTRLARHHAAHPELGSDSNV
ncbi:hypothetical protein ACK3TF_001887 [Chlorella vulgaris]